MKSEPICIPCALRQGRRVLSLLQQKKQVDDSLLEKIEATLEHESLEQTPAELSMVGIRPVMEKAGGIDPFRELKQESNRAALHLYLKLKDIVSSAGDPVATSFRLAVVGNIVDLGIREDYDLDESLDRAMKQGFNIDLTEELKAELSRATRLLYLCDNSGEVLFDRVCIETLRDHYANIDIKAVVNSGPVLNDATMEDARQVGLDKVCPVLETGYDVLGTLVDDLSDECRRAYFDADVIISKGQANYETLEQRPENIFFILMAKCECVAEHLGLKVHELALTRGSGYA